MKTNDILNHEKYTIYAIWRNNKGADCKTIGPSAKCFCDHKYKDHNYISSIDKKIHCKIEGCPCPNYCYIPILASQDFKCLCKHSYKEHDPITKKCAKGRCGCGVRFSSGWSCTCGLKFQDHYTVVNTNSNKVGKKNLITQQDNLIGYSGIIEDSLDHFAASFDAGKSPNKNKALKDDSILFSPDGKILKKKSESLSRLNEQQLTQYAILTNQLQPKENRIREENQFIRKWRRIVFKLILQQL